MSFTDLFIRRPVLAIVVNLLIIIAGVQAIRSLNVRQYPRSENAAITVTTVYVGANADLVRGFITAPLERVIAAADGIDYIESESKQNVSLIRARLRLNRDATRALAEIGPKGNLVQVNLTANTDLRSPEEFEQMVVRQSGGATVRLRDIADVQLGAEDYDVQVNFSGTTAVFIGVWVLPNANALDVIKKVHVEMNNLQRDIPEQIKAVIAYDATAYIRSAISEVVETLLETVLIVVIVIFLFLGSLRSSLVPVVAIPLSLIGGIFLVQAFGFTINLLTLLAIVLSVGLVVDDAIVVVENVERHLREGLKPIDAALKGARELVGPIISMTITLAAVYAPIAFQGGLTGSLFREFALTLAGSVALSGGG